MSAWNKVSVSISVQDFEGGNPNIDHLTGKLDFTSPFITEKAAKGLFNKLTKFLEKELDKAIRMSMAAKINGGQ